MCLLRAAYRDASACEGIMAGLASKAQDESTAHTDSASNMPSDTRKTYAVRYLADVSPRAYSSAPYQASKATSQPQATRVRLQQTDSD